MRVLQTAREMTETQSREVATRLLLAEALEISGAARGFVWFAADAQAEECFYGLEANGRKITEEPKSPLRLAWEPSLQARGPILLSSADPLFAKFGYSVQKIIWAPFRYVSELHGGLVLADPHPEPAASNLALLGLLVDLGAAAMNNVLRVERMAARIHYLSDYDETGRSSRDARQKWHVRRSRARWSGCFFSTWTTSSKLTASLGMPAATNFLRRRRIA